MPTILLMRRRKGGRVEYWNIGLVEYAKVDTATIYIFAPLGSLHPSFQLSHVPSFQLPYSM